MLDTMKVHQEKHSVLFCLILIGLLSSILVVGIGWTLSRPVLSPEGDGGYIYKASLDVISQGQGMEATDLLLTVTSSPYDSVNVSVEFASSPEIQLEEGEILWEGIRVNPGKTLMIPYAVKPTRNGFFETSVFLTLLSDFG